MASAGHHLVCAAAAGDVRALRDLRSLCQGLSASEVLVGVKMRESDLPLLEPWLKSVTLRLAAAGDIGAMLEMAGGRDSDGVAWLRAAVAKFDESTDEERSNLAAFGCARHQVLEKLGAALVEKGERAAASEAYQEASDAAMEAGKAKISMRLATLAEQFAEEEEEEDGA